MELGHYQLQFFISLTVIVVAALIALACDFLKRNNEQLRELTIELRVRREEEEKRLQASPARPEPASKVEPAAPVVAAAASPTVLAAPSLAAPSLAAPSLAAPRAHAEKPSRSERKRTVNAEALAAMERGAALAGSGGRPKSMVAAPEPVEEVAPAPVAAAKPASTSGVKKDWSSILSRKPQTQAAPAAQPAFATSTVMTSLPAGFQDGYVLNKLVKNHQPVSGLVVSIGVNATRKADGTLPESVHQLVQSLIGPNDFAAQSSDEEFLLIYPEEKGASAQRRLSQIAQQLWDFQLRQLGSFQILFSWGGVEVRSESIDEAIASASERMQETKRGRKLITMSSPTAQSGSPLRQAV